MKRAVIITGIVILLLVLAGFLVSRFVSQLKLPKVQIPDMELKPQVRSVTNKWGQVTDESTEVVTTLVVFNPAPFSYRVTRANCDITVSGVKAGRSEVWDVLLEKKAETPVTLTTRIDNSTIASLLAKHLGSNEKSTVVVEGQVVFALNTTDFTYPFRLEKVIQTDVLSPLRKTEPIVIEKKENLPLLGERTVFKITIKNLNASWGNVSGDTVEAVLSATVHNDNLYPMPLPKVVYQIDSNGIARLSGEIPSNGMILPKSEKQLSTSIKIETVALGNWCVCHIKQGERSTVNVKASLVFELPEWAAKIWGKDRLVIPVWEESYTFQTDVLSSIRFP